MEDVYRVAPVPEEYMKYQLHLNTGLEMDQIDQWFKDRHERQGTLPEKKSEWSRGLVLLISCPSFLITVSALYVIRFSAAPPSPAPAGVTHPFTDGMNAPFRRCHRRRDSDDRHEGRRSLGEGHARQGACSVLRQHRPAGATGAGRCRRTAAAAAA